MANKNEIYNTIIQVDVLNGSKVRFNFNEISFGYMKNILLYVNFNYYSYI
jgi:hypothetical protein